MNGATGKNKARNSFDHFEYFCFAYSNALNIILCRFISSLCFPSVLLPFYYHFALLTTELYIHIHTKYITKYFLVVNKVVDTYAKCTKPFPSWVGVLFVKENLRLRSGRLFWAHNNARLLSNVIVQQFAIG